MNRGRINQGILFICIGLYFLLRNFGWIDGPVIGTILANWPVLLIFAGLHLLFSRTRLWFIPALLTILVFLALIGVAPIPLPLLGTTDTHVSPFQFDVPASVGSVQVIVDANAADFTIQRGAAVSVSGNVEYTWQAPESAQRIDDDRFIVEFKDHSASRRRWFDEWQPPSWQVYVPATLPTSLEVNASAGNLTLDLRGIDARRVDVSTSAANVHLMFDQTVVHAMVSITTAASNINISVPEGIGLRIQSTGALVVNNLKELGLNLEGDWYISPDYHQADRKVEVHTTAAAGILRVNRPHSI